MSEIFASAVVRTRTSALVPMMSTRVRMAPSNLVVDGWPPANTVSALVDVRPASDCPLDAKHVATDAHGFRAWSPPF